MYVEKVFGSLDHQAKVLEVSFNLLKERKITYLDPEAIEDLIEGNNEKYIN